MIAYFCDECGKRFLDVSAHAEPIVRFSLTWEGAHYHFCGKDCRDDGVAKLLRDGWTAPDRGYWSVMHSMATH